MQTMPAIDILTYTDYRSFLADFYRQEKSRSRAFSFTTWAGKVGVKSRSQLHLVISGKRNLREPLLSQLSKQLALGKTRAEYFSELVFFNQANSPVEKAAHLERMLFLAKRRSLYRNLGLAEASFYSHWCTAAIKEILAVPGFRGDERTISKLLKGAISLNQAKEAIRTLSVLGLCARADDGSWIVNNTRVFGASSLSKAGLREFHRSMLTMAAQSLDGPTGERFVNGVTLTLGETQYAQATQLMAEFRQKFNHILSGAPVQSEPRVYHLHLQLFPLSKPINQEPQNEQVI